MTFYNERLDGVVYPRSFEVVGVFTELCEVIVQGKYTKKNHILYPYAKTSKAYQEEQ